MATLSLTGVLGAAIVLAGYVLFVRDRPGVKLFWLALAGSGVALAIYYAHQLGILARFQHIDLPGTSIYFRLTAPYTLITESLVAFPLGYPLGQTDFIASRALLHQLGGRLADQHRQHAVQGRVLLRPARHPRSTRPTCCRLARYLLLKRHAVGLIMLSLLIGLATTGAGWAHHFVLMIGYAIVVGRYLRGGAAGRAAPAAGAARRRFIRPRSAARPARGRPPAARPRAAARARRWRSLTWP